MVNDSMTGRVERVIDHWNRAPRELRHTLSGRITSLSLGLAELLRLKKSLELELVRVERELRIGLVHREDCDMGEDCNCGVES